MRKIVILGLFLLIFVISGVFTVDERENVVLTDYRNNHIVYAKGIHFALPLINHINYIFMNQRNFLFEISKQLTTKELNQIKLNILVNWHVVNPITYLSVVKKYGSTEFNNILAKELILKVESFVSSNTLNHINQKREINNMPIQLDNLGIIVEKLEIENLSLLPPPELSSGSSSVNNKQKLIKDAYYQAQQIKTDTQVEEAKLYSQIKNKNPKFYDYFRKIEIYKASAKSRSEVPSLKQLYN
ncbi:MAG TPA: SPFH domain-containing protein [Burkholderiales bacterium]|nr:SPFH domain-containing protein [Burkholderiales bacterium]